MFSPLETVEHDMCKYGCYMYYEGDNTSICPNPKCKKNCYDNESKAFATVKQVSLAEQLALLMSCKTFRNQIQYKSSRHTVYQNNDSGLLKDVFDGELLRSSDDPINGCTNLHLAMYSDGFNPFKRGGVNMNIVMFVIMSLSLELRLAITCNGHTPFC